MIATLCILAAAVGSAAGPAAAAPSVQAGFDCSRASSTVERLICADAQLALYDRAIASVYPLALKGGGAGKLRLDQRRWMQDRDKCSDTACLQQEYETNLSDLFENVPRHTHEWRRADKTGALTLIPLGRDDYAFYLNAFYQGRMPGAVNVGEVAGAFHLHDGAAVFHKEGCQITFGARRTAWSIDVDPQQDCGPGHNVTFDGLYRR